MYTGYKTAAWKPHHRNKHLNTISPFRAPDNFWVKCVFTPYFLTQCWFSKFQVVFSPPIFFRNAEKRGTYITVFSVYLPFCVVLDISFVVICFCLWYYIANACFCHNTCRPTQRKPLTICWQTDRQMDLFNPEFYFCFSFDNCYAQPWYLMRTAIC